MRLPILLIALAAAAPLAAQDRQPPFTVVETGKSFWRLDEAVKSIGDGDGTISIGQGRYRDCAIQTAGRIAYVARTPGTAILDGAVCEGKAALVLRGRAAHVEGITFTHMAVPDGNGAGIRLEHGTLTVEDSHFQDSQSGILSADDPASTISVDRSTFEGLGTCPNGGGCAHSLYIGNYGALKVTRSRFERGTGGHYVKSRAARVEISGSSFDDSRGNNTNYMIDLPAGATGTITGNTFVQGSHKENHSAFIAVAAEAREHRSQGLAVSGNQAAIAPGITWPTVFVADWSHEPLAIGANQLGRGIGKFEQR